MEKTGRHEQLQTVPRKIEGQWVSFLMPQPDRVSEAFGRGEVKNAHIPYMYGVDQLPGSLSDIALDVDQYDEETFHELSAEIHFEDSNGLFSTDEWEHTLIASIAERLTGDLSIETVYMSEDYPNLCFVKLDDSSSFCVRVTTEDAESGQIQILHTTNRALEQVMDIELETPPETIPTQSAFHKFDALLHTLVAATDSAAALSGARPTDVSAPFIISLAPQPKHKLPTPEPNSPLPVTTHEWTPLEQQLIDFDDIGGNVLAKQRLQEIANALLYPELAKKYQIAASSILLHGRTGVGKTILVRAFARGLGARLMEKRSTDILESSFGASARNMQNAFDEAKEAAKLSPVVMFTDNFETLVPQSEHAEYVGLKTVIKQGLVDIRETYPNRLLFAATTGADLADIDPELIRAGRLEPIEVPIPKLADRKDIWLRLLMHAPEWNTNEPLEKQLEAQESLYDMQLDLGQLALLTEDMTGADFAEILERTRRQKFREALAGSDVSPISQQDIETTIADYRRTARLE